MLNIVITGHDTNDRLMFEVNGKPGNGDGSEIKKEKVHWRVQNGRGVYSIEDIIMKPNIPGRTSVDIFSNDPPARQTPDGTQWKATVNENAPTCAVYHYDIHWKKTKTDPIIIHDPQISVKPSLLISIPVAIAVAFVGLLSLAYCFSKINSITKHRNL